MIKLSKSVKDKALLFVLINLFFVNTLFSQKFKVDDKEFRQNFYSITLGNLLSKISYERIRLYQIQIDNGDLNHYDFTSHILDTNLYYYLSFEIIKDNIECLSDYDIIAFSGFPQFYYRNNEFAFGAGSPFPYYESLMGKGVLFVNKTNGRVLFAGGYLFLDNIKSIFFEPYATITQTQMESYIKYRFYNYEPSQIQFKEELTIFYSNITEKKYMVRIYPDEKDGGIFYEEFNELKE